MRTAWGGGTAAVVALLAAAIALLVSPAPAPAQTVSARSGILIEP